VWFTEWGTPKKRHALVLRFLIKTRPVPGSECIEWIGAIDNHGYGVFRSPLNKRRGTSVYGTSKAHRVAYWFVRGPVPSNRSIDHECRFTRCVNPYHLRLVIPYINTALGNIDRHNNPVYDLVSEEDLDAFLEDEVL